MVQEIDTDGNGVIDYNEFLTVMTKRRLMNVSTIDLRYAFGINLLFFPFPFSPLLPLCPSLPLSLSLSPSLLSLPSPSPFSPSPSSPHRPLASLNCLTFNTEVFRRETPKGYIQIRDLKLALTKYGNPKTQISRADLNTILMSVGLPTEDDAVIDFNHYIDTMTVWLACYLLYIM